MNSKGFESKRLWPILKYYSVLYSGGSEVEYYLDQLLTRDFTGLENAIIVMSGKDSGSDCLVCLSLNKEPLF